MSQITAVFFFSGTCTTLYHVSNQATMSIKKSSTYFIYRSYLELVRCRFLIYLPQLLQLHAWSLRWLYKPINKPTLKKNVCFYFKLEGKLTKSKRERERHDHTVQIEIHVAPFEQVSLFSWTIKPLHTRMLESCKFDNPFTHIYI